MDDILDYGTTRTPCNRYGVGGKLTPKIKFKTKVEANRYAIKRNFQNGLKKERLAPYECTVCGMFHVGRDGNKITRAYANKAKEEYFDLKIVGKLDLTKLK